jgi:hypothetical protein
LGSFKINMFHRVACAARGGRLPKPPPNLSVRRCLMAGHEVSPPNTIAWRLSRASFVAVGLCDHLQVAAVIVVQLQNVESGCSAPTTRDQLIHLYHISLPTQLPARS